MDIAGVPGSNTPDTGAPAVPGAQNTDSPPAGDDAAPQDGQDGQQQDTGDPIHPRINELTFHRRRAERVAAEAIQENQALRSYLAQVDAAIRAQQGGNGQQQPTQGDAPPQEKDFQDWPSYMRAVAAHEYRTGMARDRQNQATFNQAQQAAQIQAMQVHEARVREATLNGVVEQAVQKWPDFERVISNPQLPSLRQVAPAVLDALVYSEKAADLLYHLGKNVPEALRIAGMHPVAAVRELGKLEARIAAGTVQSSAAPPPVDKVSARSSAGDPMSDRTSIEDWMNARNRQVRKGK